MSIVERFKAWYAGSMEQQRRRVQEDVRRLGGEVEWRKPTQPITRPIASHANQDQSSPVSQPEFLKRYREHEGDIRFKDEVAPEVWDISLQAYRAGDDPPEQQAYEESGAALNDEVLRQAFEKPVPMFATSTIRKLCVRCSEFEGECKCEKPDFMELECFK